MTYPEVVLSYGIERLRRRSAGYPAAELVPGRRGRALAAARGPAPDSTSGLGLSPAARSAEGAWS
jgi:hypothetical protein